MSRTLHALRALKLLQSKKPPPVQPKGWAMPYPGDPPLSPPRIPCGSAPLRSAGSFCFRIHPPLAGFCGQKEKNPRRYGRSGQGLVPRGQHGTQVRRRSSSTCVGYGFPWPSAFPMELYGASLLTTPRPERQPRDDWRCQAPAVSIPDRCFAYRDPPAVSCRMVERTHEFSCYSSLPPSGGTP